MVATPLRPDRFNYEAYYTVLVCVAALAMFLKSPRLPVDGMILFLAWVAINPFVTSFDLVFANYGLLIYPLT